jgi:hypothetical protein
VIEFVNNSIILCRFEFSQFLSTFLLIFLVLSQVISPEGMHLSFIS